MNTVQQVSRIIFRIMFPLLLWAFPLAAQAASPWSGILDPSRAIDWSQAGAGTIPDRTTLCASLTPANTLKDINNAIANCPSGQVVYLAAGTYNVSDDILFNNKSNVTLRGAGPDQTTIVWSASGDCNGLGDDICVINADSNYCGDPHNVATWTAGYVKGSNSITLGAVTTGSISNLHVGSLLILDQNSDYPNDPGNIYVCDSTGCSQQGGTGCGRAGTNGAVGRRVQNQQVTVTSISGSGPWTIGITPALYAPNWRSAMAPGAWWSSSLPVTGVGIENMTLDHRKVPATGAGILFANAANSWVKNIRSLNSAVHKHVWEYQSSHITVRDSYFYGGTGTSENYGVDAGCSSSDNLTENNIFQHLATAAIGEDGAGIVFGYNFAADNFYNNGDPEWQQEDAYHHSAGDNYFLWEGQIGSGLCLDDIHGSSFMMTAFRNRFSGRDPSLSAGAPKDEQTIAMSLFAYNRCPNMVGNVLGTQGYHTNYEEAAASASDPGNSSLGDVSIFTIGYSGNEGTLFSGVPNDPLVKTTLMRWGNYDTVNNAIRWNASEVPSNLSLYANPVPASQALPASFYLSAKPSWWPASIPWPPIGPDVTGGNVANVGGHAYLTPSANCYLNVMGGKTDGSSGVLTFNANTCYGQSSGNTAPPLSPKNLRIR